MVCAATLASPAAMAGVTGNVGAVSEYLFRGVEQSNGAAVQGGVDLATDGGFYAGTWVSNIAFAGTSGQATTYETDLYTGFTKKFGNVGFDVGAIYYYYRDETAFNTLEVYAGVLLGPAAIKVYYTPEYFGATDANGDDLDGIYATANAAIALNDTLSLTPQVGFSTGDGPEVFFGTDAGGNPDGEYLDYSVTLTKTLDAGLSFSFAVVGTTLDTTLFPQDDEKIVVGLKKTFDL